MSGPWRRAPASGATACVEARASAGGVEVRDSKNPGGPVLAYTPAEWAAFLDGVKRGEFDGLVAP